MRSSVPRRQWGKPLVRHRHLAVHDALVLLQTRSTWSQHRRALLAAAAVVVLSIGAWRAYAWWTFEPWPRMNEIMTTFEPPPDFERTLLRDEGDRPAVVALSFSGQPPVVRADYSGPPTPDLCKQLGAAMDEWAEQVREWKACSFEGEVDGHGVSAFVLDDTVPHRFIVHIGN
jgi:hypothetical protein